MWRIPSHHSFLVSELDSADHIWKTKFLPDEWNFFNFQNFDGSANNRNEYNPIDCISPNNLARKSPRLLFNSCDTDSGGETWFRVDFYDAYENLPFYWCWEYKISAWIIKG